MSPNWIETYLGLIFQMYALAFFVLGVAALLSMRRDDGTGMVTHLGWLAAFGMLHGLQEFVDGERLRNFAVWLVVLGAALMVVSFAALLEFGRLLWNERPDGRRLAALPLYGVTGLGIAMLLVAAPSASSGLELGARYLLGVPGATLAGIGLLAHARLTARAPDSGANALWLNMAGVAMLGYAGLTLFLSPGSGSLLADGLPTTADFLAITGLPVQLARGVCAVMLAVGFVFHHRQIGDFTTASLRRVTNRLDGFVYRSRNDRNWTVTFMSDGGETLTGYPAKDFRRGERHFADQIHPDDQQRVWDEVQVALAARRDFRLQYRMLDRAGTVRWCFEEGCGVFDAQGKLLYLEGLVRNDDARHQAEDAQRRMQALVEASPQAVGWADPDGTVRYFNAALRTLLAVPEGLDISFYRLRDFYDERSYEQLESTVLPTVVAKGVWVGEVELTALDGRRIPTLHSVFALRDEECGITALANVVADLSEIRAAQRDLYIKDTAIATANSAIALAGPDGALTYVNQAFAELWGLASPEKALGRSALSFWDKPDQAQAVMDTLARHGRWQGELIGRRADGSLVDVQLTGHMVLDHDGKPLCMMGSFLDVSARNQALQALQRERDFAKKLLDTAPVIILLLDPQGMIRHVNPWFEQLTGYRLDEVVGKEWFATFLPARDQARIRELFASALDDQPVRGNINPIVTRDGEERAIEWHAMPLRDADGQRTGLLSIGMDVTERQQLESQLFELNQSLERRVAERTDELAGQLQRNTAILGTAIDGFFAADAHGRICQTNPAYCAMLGYEESELLGMSIPDVEAAETPEETAAHIQKVLAQGYDRFDTRHRRKDGSTIELEVSGSLVILGDEAMFYAFARDIGPRKAAEVILSQARDEAERASSAKSEFLSRMSHELRTPLNAILGFTQLLQLPDEHPLSTQQADNVQEILKAGQHLLVQVNEVLDLARIESGRIELRLEALPLAPLVADCIALVQPLALARGITVAPLLHPMPAESSTLALQGDATRVKQVLLNLLTNAIKYNCDGGQVLVAVLPAGKRVRIEVRDTGRGIAPEKQPRLFRPFERLESAYEGIEGTGVGLALAKQLVESMGGEIGVESKVDGGSTFWFALPAGRLPELPVAADPKDHAGQLVPAVPGVPPSAPVSVQNQRRVLYIEDHPANLKLVKKIIGQRPALTLLDAINAELGLEIARRERPDLILLDINLPGMSGFEALKALQADPATRRIPVIAVTANAMKRDIDFGMAVGFAEYITKPLDVDRFLGIIDRYLFHRKE